MSDTQRYKPEVYPMNYSTTDSRETIGATSPLPKYSLRKNGREFTGLSTPAGTSAISAVSPSLTRP
jgi:hypothetical protein